MEDLNAEMEYLESSVQGCRRKVAKAEQGRAAHAGAACSERLAGALARCRGTRT